VELIETSTFTRQITALLSDEDYGPFSPGWQRIQVSALSSKAAAEYADSRRVWFARQVWGRPRHLLLPKNVSADLTPKQVAQLAKVVKEEFRDETENV